MTDLKIYILQIVSAAIQGKKLVPRRRGNKIILANSPTIDKNRVPTLRQQEHLHRFSAAASYASAAIANPELEKIYRKKTKTGRSRFTNAVRDYMRAPEVKRIDTTDYYGNPGSIIRVKAKDDFYVKEVKVSIYNHLGRLVEEGNASIDTMCSGMWNYTARKRVLSHRYTIKAVAMDLPGNTGQLEVTYHAFTYRGQSFLS